MNIPNSIPNFRKPKGFDSAHRIRKKEIEKLLSLTLSRPSAFNAQNWRFVLIHNAEQKKQLCETVWNRTLVSDASLLVILCADINAIEVEPLNYWCSSSIPIMEMIASNGRYSQGELDQAHRDDTMLSCGIAAQTLMMAANSMGYDACPIDGFNAEAISDQINLPDNYMISTLITIGKATNETLGTADENLLESLVVTNRF